MADDAFLRRVRAECSAGPRSGDNGGSGDGSWAAGGGGRSGTGRSGGAKRESKNWPAKPSGPRPKRVDSSTLGDAVRLFACAGQYGKGPDERALQLCLLLM